MSKSVFPKSFVFFRPLLFLVLAGLMNGLFAQVVQVDLNFSGRNESEVHSPDYSSWVISGGTETSFTKSGVEFKFSSNGFSSGWYKAGIQSPNFARLVSDGLTSGDITLTISGLPAGKHTLLSFHNSFSNPETNTFSNIEIYNGDQLLIDDFQQSNRVLKDSDAATAYITFQVSAGETAEIRFRVEPASTSSDKSVYINGFELNTPDAARQSSQPYPSHMDEHADADNGSIELTWKAATDALSHNFYIGTNQEEVTNADPGSSLFKGNQISTKYLQTINLCDPYYWRVDGVFKDDTVRGDVWYFKPRHLAFEGAEGYGRFAIGGRGGSVVAVTNLNDDGPGSLREAVTNSIGPRTVVFNVSGLIELKSRLTLTDDYVTVAGQTAPGKGICIKGAPFGMSGASDGIIRFMRVRVGSGTTYDGMGMQGGKNSIIDHSSISWTIDESFSSRSGQNITLQRTLISEPLNQAGHQNYPAGTKHGYAASISGDIGSFHHNLLAHSYGRNWSLAGGLTGDGIYAGRLDISNNVVYNFGKRTTDGGAHEVNFIANYYKPGPGHQGNNYALNAQYDNFPGTQRYYFAGNVMPGYFDESNQEKGRRYSGSPQGYSPWVDQAFFPSQITLQTAYEAYKDVISDVGSNQPLDMHDIRVLQETFNGTAKYQGSKTRIPGMPDSQEDVGGWEDYPEESRPENWDTDEDGMPNWWEDLVGLDKDHQDGTADADLDGYTNLEEYLMWLASNHHILEDDSVLSIDLKDYALGYGNDPVFEILSMENLQVVLEEGVNIAKVTPDKVGLGNFRYKVKDAEGDTKIIQVNVAACSSAEEVTLLEVGKKTVTILYPNPVTDLVRLESERFIQSYEVFDLNG
ncbi:MAG: hypothetical protein RIA69_09830, partial [Cyclobacteriaceae bacterium]